MKRPLLTASVLFLCLMLFLKMIRPASSPDGTEELERYLSGRTVCITGKVLQHRQTEDGCSMVLNKLSFSDAAGEKENITQEYEDSVRVSIPGNAKILVYSDEGADPWIYGDPVTVVGEAGIFDSAQNPGQFDFRSYYHNRNILFFVSAVSVSSAGTYSPSCVTYRQLDKLRKGMRSTLYRILDPEDAPVMAAILLGERYLLPDETRKLYTDTGILHILTISGLHIQLIGAGIYSFLRKRRCSFMTCGIWSILIILLYGALTGNGLSCTRAVITFIIRTGAQIFGVREDKKTSMAAALLVMTAFMPYSLTEVSFWLSFGCVGSLLFLAPVFQMFIPGRLRNHPLSQSISASAAITVGTLPVLCRFYFCFSVYAVLANLLVLPFVGFLCTAGLAGGVLGIFSYPAGRFTVSVCHYILRLYHMVCVWINRLPMSVMVTGRPSGIKTFFFYMLVGAGSVLVLCGKRDDRAGKKSRKAPAFILICIGLVIFLYPERPAFRMTFLSVGQGECILISSRGRHYMVDCGSDTVPGIWEKRVEPCLLYYGIRHLDCVFLTHGDADHVNGIRQYMELQEQNRSNGSCSRIVIDEICTAFEAEKEDEGLLRLLRETGNEKIKNTKIRAGDMIDDSNITIRCLYPDAKYLTDDANQNSLVLLVTWKNVSFLLTGDLEKEGEEDMLKRNEKILSQLGTVMLKAGHHGSRYATSEHLLSVVRPCAAVISCGKDNIYGHPAKEMTDRLEAKKIPYWRTDLDGAVIVGVKGKKTLVIAVPWK